MIKQHNNHNCDLYIIRNIKILMIRQILSQHIVDIENLRLTNKIYLYVMSTTNLFYLEDSSR